MLEIGARKMGLTPRRLRTETYFAPAPLALAPVSYTHLTLPTTPYV